MGRDGRSKAVHRTPLAQDLGNMQAHQRQKWNKLRGAKLTTADNQTTAMSKPILLHCGDDVRWNHDLYAKVKDKFDIERSHSIGREEFKQALVSKQFGDFYAIFRPFYSTGGEMGRWDAELMCACWRPSHDQVANLLTATSFLRLARSMQLALQAMTVSGALCRP